MDLTQLKPGTAIIARVGNDSIIIRKITKVEKRGITSTVIRCDHLPLSIGLSDCLSPHLYLKTGWEIEEVSMVQQLMEKYGEV